jgi:hypothetical protein
MRPVRADSRIPKGEISLRKESILEGLAELLQDGVSHVMVQGDVDEDLHFDNAAVSADIQNLASELVGEVGDALQVLVLMSQCLAGNEAAGVEVTRSLLERGIALGNGVDLACRVNGRDLAMMGKELLEILWAKNVDLSKQEFPLDERSLCVVQNCPNRDQILQLTPRLLDNAILPRQDNGHAGEVVNLGTADDKRVDIEASGCQNARNTGKNTRFVLDETVQDMSFRGSHRRQGGLVEDVGDGRLR